MSAAREAVAVARSFGQFDIRPKNPAIAVGALSGGNQQKVVLAKEILGEPRLLLLDEPTRGVDVGAKGEIYARLRELAAQGLGILVASSRDAGADRALRPHRRAARGARRRGVHRRGRRAHACSKRQTEGSPMSEASAAAGRQATSPPKRRDPLALVVRFQSLIGLVRRGARRHHLLAAPPRRDPVPCAGQYRQHRARGVRDRHHRHRHDLRHHHRGDRPLGRRAAWPRQRRHGDDDDLRRLRACADAACSCC